MAIIIEYLEGPMDGVRLASNSADPIEAQYAVAQFTISSMGQIGTSAIDIFLAPLDLALPVLQLILQEIEDAANLDLGRAEGFLRFRSVVGQGGVQRFERVERMDSS